MKAPKPRMTCAIDERKAKGYETVDITCTVAGVQVGKLAMWKRRESGRDVMSVTNVIVNPSYRRRGLGTQLYERAATVACRDFGLPLASDRHTSRSKLAEGFWKKQLRKKRAICIGESGTKRCEMFVLSCPPPSSLEATKSPIKMTRDTSRAGLLVEKVTGHKHYSWVCDEARLGVAKFVERRDPARYAILHRSTHPDAEPWQLTWFDSHGPSGHIEAKTCQAALRDVPRGVYRLREVQEVLVSGR